MEDSKLQTVVLGEASESDEDDKEEKTDAPVISGEASESEEEDDISRTQPSITPLRVDTDGKGDRDDITAGDVPLTPTFPTGKISEVASKPKYDTLLHRKLRERNTGLRRHLTETVKQAYLSCSKELHNTSQHLHKTQAIFVDVNFNMRNLTNDLFKLEDTVDTITSCELMPKINLDLPSS